MFLVFPTLLHLSPIPPFRLRAGTLRGKILSYQKDEATTNIHKNAKGVVDEY
jgi:hypothetical protein